MEVANEKTALNRLWTVIKICTSNSYRKLRGKLIDIGGEMWKFWVSELKLCDEHRKIEFVGKLVKR